MKKILWFISPIIFLIILWEIISNTGIINTNLFPPPSRIGLAFGQMLKDGTLALDLTSSLWRALTGLILGSTIGIGLGLLTGRIQIIAKSLTPIIQILRPIPPVAIIPLVIVWFGIDNSAKIFAISFAVFFPVWLNSHIGAKQIPTPYLWSAKLLTNSILKKFKQLIFPATLPFIIAGIRNGIAIAFIMVFVTELTGASSGLGYRISFSHLIYRLDQMIAALFVLGGLGAVTDLIFVFSTKKLFSWLKFTKNDLPSN
jgi:NitT/TauT family transport system permease protein